MIRFCDGMSEERYGVAEEIGRETGEVDERGMRGGLVRLRLFTRSWGFLQLNLDDAKKGNNMNRGENKSLFPVHEFRSRTGESRRLGGG